MPASHATAQSQDLAANVLYALRKSKVTQADVARTLGMALNTLRRRLDDGAFTFGQIVVLAELTDTEVGDLLPKVNVA